MKIKPIRSDEIYKKMIAAPLEQKSDIYRYEMMKPFEKKWACYNIPLKSKQEYGSCRSQECIYHTQRWLLG